MLENGQQLIITGSILHLARIDESTGVAVTGPFRDVGTIIVANPTFGSDRIELFDARGGRRTRISVRNLNYNESYEVMCQNMSLENLSYVFGAAAVLDYSQAGSAIAAVPHMLYPDSILPLHDSSGNYYYDIAAIGSIGTLVAGTDYIVTPEGLKMGFVKIAPTATGVAAGGTSMNVTFTPNAITTSKRVFNPHTAGIAKVEAKIFWTSDDYGTLMVRDHITAEVSPASPEFRDADFSQTRLTFSVLDVLSNTSRPAGRVVHAKGAVPPRTF